VTERSDEVLDLNHPGLKFESADNQARVPTLPLGPECPIYEYSSDDEVFEDPDLLQHTLYSPSHYNYLTCGFKAYREHYMDIRKNERKQSVKTTMAHFINYSDPTVLLHTFCEESRKKNCRSIDKHLCYTFVHCAERMREGYILMKVSYATFKISRKVVRVDKTMK
jgi:hypothetical protein